MNPQTEPEEQFHLHDYSHEPRLRDMPRTFANVPRILVLSLIRAYQMLISPGLPANTCRFYPSCSHYGYQAVYKYGAFKGSFMAAWRVLRCNPFNPGGYDPVP
ncbi:MAG TPA: membrane protein insertion efficiency factor YidD [Anaerolineales bacterium]|nr:membrane protein insertion efficiency factor YidD [Anaerolineales bacterium]HNA89393.1 membrane protein insertion efficiency factor YidD [Anaerolineales bacterium]HNB36763.1 membrane protein insertion efficiency factor YidD [Anaerolineales bacterium]HNC08607.1 membrane protein insertion efficiency factor YidD [Anaerolineales bacterium]